MLTVLLAMILVTASTAAAATVLGQCVGNECAAPPDCPANCSLSQCPCFGGQVDASNYTRPLGCVAHVRPCAWAHSDKSPPELLTTPHERESQWRVASSDSRFLISSLRWDKDSLV